MSYGVIIDRPRDLIKFHHSYDIYISHRALKHFVESRKYEMKESFSDEDIINNLLYAVDNVILTYEDFDKIEFKDPDRIIYSKNYTEINKSIRIVLQVVQNRLEICSIHFQKSKNKKPP